MAVTTLPTPDETPTQPGPRVYRLGDCTVWPDQNRIARGGAAARVEPKSMDVLSRLVEAGGDTVSRDALLQAVWPNRVVVEETLSRCIAQLRAALGDDAKAPRYIETVAKRGYRLLVTPQAQAPARSTASPEIAPPPPERPAAATPPIPDPALVAEGTPAGATPSPAIASAPDAANPSPSIAPATAPPHRRRPLMIAVLSASAVLVAAVALAWPQIRLEGARAAIEQRGQDVPQPVVLRETMRKLPAARILWVDDHPENNRLEIQALERSGVTVEVALSNAEAAEQMRGREYQLVVSDIGRDEPQPQRAGLDLPREVLPDRNRLPPVLYYVAKVDQPRTPDGYPVIDQPERLFREMGSLLRSKVVPPSRES